MKTKLSGILTLLLAFVVQISFAQERTISGTITDEEGLPLPGINIIIKGTTIGTQTDFDGNYSIEASTGDVLSFSYLGFKTLDKVVGAADNNISFRMEPDSESLDEVVITAIGIKRKPDEITTANQVVKAEELNQASNPDAVQALAGKVSGLQINTTSAGLAPNTQITLRGNRSISGNNDALVVIDNVISTAQTLSNLDPNTIESINVIKGPNGAALYGEQGAAGVIIVTTKKGVGESSKFSVNIASSSTFEEIALLPETQNRFGQGWGGNIETVDQGSWGLPYNGILTPIGTPDTDGNFRYFPYSHIEDNILPFFNTGVNLQNSISMSAGNIDEGYLNFSYLNQDLKGVIPTSKLTKNNFSLTTGKKLGKLSVQGIARYTTQKTNDVNILDVDNKFEDNTYPVVSMYRQLMNTPGNVPVRAFDSGSNNDHWTIYETSPYWTLQNNRRLGNRSIIDLSAELMYEFSPHINSVLRSSIRSTQNDNEIRRNGFTDNLNFVFGDRSIRSFYQIDNDKDTFIYTDLLVNFDYNLTEDITFKSNVGLNLTYRKNTREVNGGFDLEIPGFFQLSNITSLPDFWEENTRRRTTSIFGQVDLGYKNYLFLNITGRKDWNSVLPKANLSYFYPSVGVAFIPTKAIEGLKSDILHKAKLSASYVKTGNATALDPQQLPTVAILNTTYPGTGSTSLIADSESVDPNIKPEFITSFEANANLEFLNIRGPRLTLDVSASFSKNTDQILGISSSLATGYETIFTNVGETKSKSLEIDLGFTPVKTKDFEFSGRVGFSTFETKVVKVSDQSNIVEVANSGGTAGAYAVEGQEFPLILGTAYQRDNQGRVVIDSNGNPLQNPELQVLGNATPDYILNFALNFKYKGIRLAMVADYRTGHQFFSGIKRQLSGQGRTFDTTFNDRQPFVYPNSTVEGSGETNTTVLTAGGGNLQALGEAYGYYTGGHNDIDENFVVDATAFKLREVSLSYDLPSSVVEKLKLTRLNVGVSGRNLLIILPKSNLDYNDPEFAGRFGLANYGITPPTRYYAFNINLSF